MSKPKKIWKIKTDILEKGEPSHVQENSYQQPTIDAEMDIIVEQNVFFVLFNDDDTKGVDAQSPVNVNSQVMGKSLESMLGSVPYTEAVPTVVTLSNVVDTKGVDVQNPLNVDSQALGKSLEPLLGIIPSTEAVPTAATISADILRDSGTKASVQSEAVVDSDEGVGVAFPTLQASISKKKGRGRPPKQGKQPIDLSSKQSNVIQKIKDTKQEHLVRRKGSEVVASTIVGNLSTTI
ncbi:hypothetical protein V6N11_081377 [Hibiscus sabdariffa]|uniref:Uncharacterized protein n=1 Tax=Hibiscus sabdariffa TaxID=183260 RepID=A0ABR2QJQ7_9ROSI